MSVEVRVSAAGVGQWPELSAALAEAFQADPIMSWMLPDPARRATALRRFFELECRDVALPHGLSVAAVDDSGRTLGAALIIPPGEWRMPVRTQIAQAPEFVRMFGRRLPHAFGLLTAMERRHPRRPHHYLPFIGVAPSAQGRGVGSALLTEVVRQADAARLPAYLEATDPRNARLYRRMGFAGVEVIRPWGAPPLELMLREPRPPASPS